MFQVRRHFSERFITTFHRPFIQLLSTEIMSSGTLNDLLEVSQVRRLGAAGRFVLDVDQVRNQVLSEMVRVAGECAGFAAQGTDLGPFVGDGV